jgi:hypothetical protein
MAQAGVAFLILKGAALAHLVYGDPRLRPMRDVDLLVRRADLERAHGVLARCGFALNGPAVPRHHHHTQAMASTVEGAMVTVELHHELLVRTPFVARREYDDLIGNAQSFSWDGAICHTLGCEDMLWHVYAHSFVINTTRPGAIRLVSVADLVQAVEAWVDRIDWDLLRRRYGRMLRALWVLDDLVPWSPRVAQQLRELMRRRPTSVCPHPIDSDPRLTATVIRDVLWLPEWWFRMRYGVVHRDSWLWYRSVGHPACVAVSVGRGVLARLPGTRLIDGLGSGDSAKGR